MYCVIKGESFITTHNSSTVSWLRRATRRGLVAAGVCAVPVGVIVGFVYGVQSLKGWAVALLLACVYFATGIFSDALATRHANAIGMILLLGGFVFRVCAVGVVLLVLSRLGLIADRDSKAGLAWTTLAMVVGWSWGLVHAHARSQLPIYDVKNAGNAVEVTRSQQSDNYVSSGKGMA